MENTEIQSERRVKSAVAQSAGIKKKTSFDKFKENFFKEDFKTVRDNAIENVIIPSIKKIISDTITNSIDMVLYGEPRHTSDSLFGRSGGISRISMMTPYNSLFDKKKDKPATTPSREAYEYGMVTVHSKKEAEDVIAMMLDIQSQFNDVRVADLYDLVGEVPKSTDNRYGWTDFASARYERLSDGRYLIIPPQIELLQTR